MLGHEHIPSKEAILQSIKIRINSHGLRGDEIKPKQEGIKRILFLGSSITLGWGVAEEETLTERLVDMFDAEGKPTEVLNAGVGNYNSVRYVEQFLTRLTHLVPHPSDEVCSSRPIRPRRSRSDVSMSALTVVRVIRRSRGLG